MNTDAEREQQFQAITEIRTLMERSSRFISLNGLSGVAAGIFALCGAAFAHYALQPGSRYYGDPQQLALVLIADAALVLILSVGSGIFMTFREAKKNGDSIWDNRARRLVMNMMIPLATGGVFCLILLYHHLATLIAPAMLIFYGLALVNASKYTFNDIRYLGVCEVALGLAAAFYIRHGLLFWSFGFGLLHIVYGIYMYKKYEQ